MSLSTNCPSHGLGEGSIARRRIYHRTLSLSLFTFFVIGNGEVRFNVSTETGLPSGRPTAVVGDNLTGKRFVRCHPFRGDRNTRCQLVRYDETKHDQDCCLRPKETIPNAPRTCNRLCWRKCQRFVIVSPWCTQFHLARCVCQHDNRHQTPPTPAPPLGSCN